MHALANVQVLFSLVPPHLPMKGNTVQASLQDRTCTASVVGAGGMGIVVSCQYDVPGERAKAFCNALMGQVQPEQVQDMSVWLCMCLCVCVHMVRWCQCL